MTDRLFLSPPRVSEQDIASVVQALRSGWLAPAGPELSAFEDAASDYLGVKHAVALSSGTSALHLGLKYLGVVPGMAVIVPTLTFGATAFAVTYLGAEPVFVDVDDSWNMCPELLALAIDQLRANGRPVGCVIPVDLYGTPANYEVILPSCELAGIPVLEDAAEGLGATTSQNKVGALGNAGVLSFNGNKLITTSGGGMLVTNDEAFAARVRFWSTQSRDDASWYQHSEIGYNYRLSNILAALGRSQLTRVDSEVAKRRQIRGWYHERLTVRSGVSVQLDPPWGHSNAWLTVARFSSLRFPNAPKRICDFLDANDIESRPIWKPMHQQPIFQNSTSFLSGFADALFAEGVCLPSGTAMDEEDVDRVCSLIWAALET
jgi:dTDP-4-amino-4,6-dideoxygalactose transaminase